MSGSAPILLRMLAGAMLLAALGCQQNKKSATSPTGPVILTNVVALQGSQPAFTMGHRKLSPTAAAELAAKLANQECQHLYNQQPFKPELWKAVLSGKRYQWGELDVGGPGGFSAVVTFDPNGDHPHVEIYLSRDFPQPFLRR